jgi:cell division protein FtsL
MTGEVQEKWLKWVALTTTILAVCASFASMKGGGYSTQVQLMTTQESDQWSYFEAKSIKLHLSEMEKDIFKVNALSSSDPAVKNEIQSKIKALDDNISRYTKEKDTIKNGIDNLSSKQDSAKRHGGNFGLAVMFFQISIMLSAIGSLLKQRNAWLCGLAIGFFGVVYFLNGFYLFF